MTQQLPPARDQKGETSQSGYSRKACSDCAFESRWEEVCSRLLSVMLRSSSTAKMYCVLMCSYMRARLASTLGIAQLPSAACVACASKSADHVSTRLVVTSSK